jgi:hypothetical protein
MYTRVEENDHEVKVIHYQFVGSSLAILVTWVFVYITFASEQGGVLSLLGATLALMVAGSLAELCTTQFDAAHKTVTITRRRALGPVIQTINIADIDKFASHTLGQPQLGVEYVSLQLKDGSSTVIASYVLFRGEGGGLQQYLEDSLAR